MSVRLTILAMLLLAAAAGVGAQSMMPAQRQALNAAERWLVPLDAERYTDAWTMAAESFRTNVPRELWRQGMAKIRKDYGRVVTRKGERMAFRRDMPAPDAEQAGVKPGTEVSILFETEFAGNKQAVEEITMVLEKDGVWRAAGYYIK
jgi:hypothetical protein